MSYKLWVQLRVASERFLPSVIHLVMVLKGLSHKRNFFLIVSHFITLTTICNVSHLCMYLQNILNPFDPTMRSKGVRMRVIVLPYLQKSDPGITAMLKMCLLLPRRTALPELLPPHASSEPSGTAEPSSLRECSC